MHPARRPHTARHRDSGTQPECAAFRASVFEFVDGEATEAREIAMSEHSRECPRCLAVLRAAVALSTAVRGADVPEPAPRGLRVRVAQLLADAPASDPRAPSSQR